MNKIRRSYLQGSLMSFQALGTQSVLCSYDFEVSIGHFLPQKSKAPDFLKSGFLKDTLFSLTLFLIIV